MREIRDFQKNTASKKLKRPHDTFSTTSRDVGKFHEEMKFHNQRLRSRVMDKTSAENARSICPIFVRHEPASLMHNHEQYVTYICLPVFLALRCTSAGRIVSTRSIVGRISVRKGQESPPGRPPIATSSLCPGPEVIFISDARWYMQQRKKKCTLSFAKRRRARKFSRDDRKYAICE